MDPGGLGGAFGGGKAGGAQDPLTFLKKPIVMIRLSALVSTSKTFTAPRHHGADAAAAPHGTDAAGTAQSAVCSNKM